MLPKLPAQEQVTALLCSELEPMESSSTLQGGGGGEWWWWRALGLALHLVAVS